MRTVSNSQDEKLRGQLEDYADNDPSVIALACGIDDTDGWRKLESKFSSRGIGMERIQFEFDVKRRDNFGGSDGGSGGSGGFAGL